MIKWWLAGGGDGFNFELGQKTCEDSDLSLWTIYEAKRKGSDDLVTVFALELKGCSDVQSSLAKSYVKRLRSVKHPCILSYIDSFESDKVIYLVTERVQPLPLYLRSSPLTPTQKDMVVSWGLYKLSNALQFLCTDCKLVHNNTNMHSVFVTQSGDWKLGSLEFVVPLSENGNPPSPHAVQISGRPRGLDRYVAPENRDSAGFGRKPKASSTDSWGLACIIWELYSSEPLTAPANLKSMQNIPKTLQPAYKELIQAPENRPSPEEFVTLCRSPKQPGGGFMKNVFVETMQFLEEIQIKETEQKNRFFAKLNDSLLDVFPRDIAKQKLIPALVNAFEFGNAGASVLAPLLQLGKLLEADEYQRRIVPCIVKLFSSPDRATRVKLLQQIEQFAEHMQAPIVNEKIFPNIATGFLDTNPAVREASVKAMVYLAPKLNYTNLNIELMKYFAQLQGRDDQSIIRTNTTVCLGKIAPYLDPKNRQKIILSAFARALKDPFPPARISGVLALAGTQQYYQLNEVAHRILPALSVLTMDPEKTVREHAFKAIKAFLGKLEKASENPELIAEMEADVLSGGGASRNVITGATPWSWALGALGSKFYKPPAQPVPTAQSCEPASSENKQEAPSVKQPEAKAARQEHWSDGEEDWGDIEPVAPGRKPPEQVKKPESISSVSASDGWGEEELDEEEWGSLETQEVKPVDRQKSEVPAGASLSAMKKMEERRKDVDVNSDEFFLQTVKSSQKASLSAKTTPSSTTKSPAESSGWDDWGDVDVAKNSAKNDSKNAERNERRRQEIEQRRQQKGAMKLGSKIG